MAKTSRKTLNHRYEVYFIHYKKGGLVVSSTSRVVVAKNKDEAKSQIKGEFGRIWGVTVTRLP